MANTKYADLAVKVGEYTDQQGQTKNRYKNVGVLMQGDNGKYILLDRTFNPAGVPNPDNRENLMVSIFTEQNDKGAGGNNQGGQRQSQANAHSVAKGNAHQPADLDDEIPF